MAHGVATYEMARRIMPRGDTVVYRDYREVITKAEVGCESSGEEKEVQMEPLAHHLFRTCDLLRPMGLT